MHSYVCVCKPIAYIQLPLSVSLFCLSLSSFYASFISPSQFILVSFLFVICLYLSFIYPVSPLLLAVYPSHFSCHIFLSLSFSRPSLSLDCHLQFMQLDIQQ
jgi:hypothetical protein